MKEEGIIGFFRAGNIYVVDKDLSPDGIIWKKVPEFIEGFKKIYPGYNFRLPNMWELRYLYSLKKEGIGKFKKRYYWGSELVEGETFYSLDFESGANYVLKRDEYNNEIDDPWNSFRVRLVIDV
jgi:hypothetical protein